MFPEQEEEHSNLTHDHADKAAGKNLTLSVHLKWERLVNAIFSPQTQSIPWAIYCHKRDLVNSSKSTKNASLGQQCPGDLSKFSLHSVSAIDADDDILLHAVKATDANLDCVFVENTLIFAASNIRGGGFGPL